MSEDTVTLRVGGIDWTGWKSVEISRQMDAIAGAFSIALADKWKQRQTALPIAAGMACELLIGKDMVINGHIDRVSHAFSASEHSISISGRDKSADLVDCSAIHAPGQWLDQDVLSLARELAAPFGVSVAVSATAPAGLPPGGQDLGGPVPSFKLEQGETTFEALSRLLRQRGLLACPDGRGGIILLKSGELYHRVVLKQGENILTASADFDLSDRFSAYHVQGQQPGSDEAFGEAACAVEAEASDPAARRYRPLLLRAESNVDAASAKGRATWEASVRAARSVTLNVTVQGFRQSKGGSLWQVGALTEVDIPFLRLRQTMLASKLTFKRDNQGSITSLELKDPGAFAPEPREAPPGQVGPIEKEKDLQTRFAEDAAEEQEKIKNG
jgi:prophage tail gpP-like protein